MFQVYLSENEEALKEECSSRKIISTHLCLSTYYKKSLYKALDENISGCQPYFQPTLHTDVLSN